MCRRPLRWSVDPKSVAGKMMLTFSLNRFRYYTIIPVYICNYMSPPLLSAELHSHFGWPVVQLLVHVARLSSVGR